MQLHSFRKFGLRYASNSKLLVVLRGSFCIPQLQSLHVSESDNPRLDLETDNPRIFSNTSQINPLKVYPDAHLSHFEPIKAQAAMATVEKTRFD